MTLERAQSRAVDLAARLGPKWLPEVWGDSAGNHGCCASLPEPFVIQVFELGRGQNPQSLHQTPSYRARLHTGEKDEYGLEVRFERDAPTPQEAVILVAQTARRAMTHVAQILQLLGDEGAA